MRSSFISLSPHIPLTTVALTVLRLPLTLCFRALDVAVCFCTVGFLLVCVDVPVLTPSYWSLGAGLGMAPSIIDLYIFFISNVMLLALYEQ